MGKSKQRRANEREIARSQTGLNQQRGKLEQAGQQFTNTYGGVQGASYDPAQAQVGTLGEAARAELAQLGPAQGYDAAQTRQVQAARGEDYLTNPYANLQVATASSDARARDAERSQAALQEQAAATGGGGATALLSASQESRQGIREDLQQQEARNAQLRAQGQQTLEQGLLGQANVGAQFDVSQQQFNVQAQNQARQFTAGAQNQFALEQFGAANQLAQFNAGAQNQFAQTQFGAANQFNLANVGAQNQAAQFGAETGFQAQQLQAQGEAQRQERAYGHVANLYSQDAARFGAARQAEADRRASNTALWGGIAGAALGAAGSILAPGP